MTEQADPLRITPPGRVNIRQLLLRKIATPGFQAWAARVPVLRGFVRREGDEMFRLVAGFCHAQVLSALVQFDILTQLLDQPETCSALAHRASVPDARMKVLLNAGAALGLLRPHGPDRYGLTVRGAALIGVPGLAGMIRHHDILYRDLGDPVAFFRGQTDTELAGFWPYVFGAEGADDTGAIETYSRLMEDSQSLVAADTLDLANLGAAASLLDVGGGNGAFACAVAERHPGMSLTVFDLPAAAQTANQRFVERGLSARARTVSGSFLTDPLPEGHDVISLVRILYDHSDDTVRALLAACREALPEGGGLLISEPMTGGKAPHPAGDAYFALYCMAMRTGRARSSAEISSLLNEAGFEVGRTRSNRPFVTTVIEAIRY